MHFFWSGKFTDYQLASILSYKQKGFDVTLWTLDDINLNRYNIPVKNSNSVVKFDPNQRYTNFYTKKDQNDFYGQISFYSDILRLKILSTEEVNYSDLDVLCLKDYDEWNNQLKDCDIGVAMGPADMVNNGIIINNNQTHFKELDRIANEWLKNKKSPYEWTLVGPNLLTKYIKFKQIKFLPKEIFYPVQLEEWSKGFSSNIDDVNYCIEKTKNSLAYHWWNDAVDHFGINNDITQSFLGKHFKCIFNDY